LSALTSERRIRKSTGLKLPFAAKGFIRGCANPARSIQMSASRNFILVDGSVLNAQFNAGNLR
jgi:hypothetical protein